MNSKSAFASVLFIMVLASALSGQEKTDEKSRSGKLDFEIVFEGSFYHQYAMKMKLKSEDGNINGEYYMAGMPGDRPVSGSIDKKGNVLLKDFLPGNEQAGVFSGKMFAGNFVSGTYKSFSPAGEISFALTKSAEPYDSWKKGINSQSASEILFGPNRNITGVPLEGEPEKFSTIEWTSTAHDFDTIHEGFRAKHDYTFRNTGAFPIVIKGVTPGCGCTTPEWSKSEIPPGETGTVNVEFDSNGKPGLQNKSVEVVTNTFPASTTLTFRAYVKGR